MTRSTIIMLLIFLAIIPFQGKSVAAQQPDESRDMVTLYAHTDYSSGIRDGKILNTAPPYGQRRSTILEREIIFVLYPSLAQELDIQGSVNYGIYLKSPVKRSVHLNISIYEVNTEGESKRASSAIVVLPVDNQITQYVMGIPLSHTFSKGSTILFSIIPKPNGSSLIFFWDDPQTDTYVALPIRRGYNVLDLKSIDLNENAIIGTNISIFVEGSRIWTGKTDATGWARALVPSAGTTLYEITTLWKDIVVNKTIYDVAGDVRLQIKCKVYNLGISTKDLLHQPIADAIVTVYRNNTLMVTGNTSDIGKIQFTQLPESEYFIEVKYFLPILFFPLLTKQNISLQLSSNIDREVGLLVLEPWIINLGVGAFTIIFILALSVTFLRRRNKKNYEYSFDYFDILTSGGIPSSTSVMVAGLPGSGKTILISQFLLKSLKSENPCIFITNVDFPSNIRRDLIEFEPKIEEYEKRSKLIFIDGYSAAGGKDSHEKYKIPAVGDLTGLGVQISSCLEKLGNNTDVFFDSLTPLFTILRDEYITNFVHSISVKIKGINGRLFYTLGTGIGKEGLHAIEAASDCVIEILSTEDQKEYHRRLRIKKMKKKHIEEWVEFKIDDSKGIIFRTSRKNNEKIK